MHYVKFSSCLADPDVWMRPAEKSDGTTYYEYVLLYVDDVLVISENAEEILREEIGKYFELKEESIGHPSLYLGGHVHQVKLDNGVNAWSFSSSQYIRTAVKNVEEWLSKRVMEGGNCQARRKRQCSCCIDPSWTSHQSYPQRSHHTTSR